MSWFYHGLIYLARTSVEARQEAISLVSYYVRSVGMQGLELGSRLGLGHDNAPRVLDFYTSRRL